MTPFGVILTPALSRGKDLALSSGSRIFFAAGDNHPRKKFRDDTSALICVICAICVSANLFPHPLGRHIPLADFVKPLAWVVKDI